jgi:hypothetical protein
MHTTLTLALLATTLTLLGAALLRRASARVERELQGLRVELPSVL